MVVGWSRWHVSGPSCFYCNKRLNLFVNAAESPYHGCYFDPGGVYFREPRTERAFRGIIGKEGDGPGEFRSINTIKTISDQIVVLDEKRQLIKWFSLDNHHLQNSVQLEISDNIEVARVNDLFEINDQTFLLQFSKMISRSERMRHYSILDHSDERIHDKFLEHPDSDIFSDNTDGFAIAMVLPFADKPLVAVSNKSDIYKAWNNDFLVKKYNYEGEYKSAFYYLFENEELVRRDVLEMYDDRFRRAIQNADFPEHWPALNDMLIDDENRLWASTIVEDFDLYEWWVLEDTGELITKFEWPRDEPIEVIKNGKMYTRETDEETGLQQVVRYGFEMD